MTSRSTPPCQSASEDRTGALSFAVVSAPPAPIWPFNSRVHLAQLREAARLIEATPAGSPLAPHIVELSHQLLKPGTSMGGARPKNVVEDDTGLWLAKFPARNDTWNNAAVEAAMLALAHACEIPVPTALVERLGNESVLLLSRFDRERSSKPGASPQYLRYRMVSALTVLDLDDDVMNRKRWSCDHPRNHALVARGRDFALSPVYDVAPHPSVSHSRDLAMICGPRGRAATRENLREGAPRFGLPNEDADSLITLMARSVAANWELFIRRRGGSAVDCNAVRVWRGVVRHMPRAIQPGQCSFLLHARNRNAKVWRVIRLTERTFGGDASQQCLPSRCGIGRPAVRERLGCQAADCQTTTPPPGRYAAGCPEGLAATATVFARVRTRTIRLRTERRECRNAQSSGPRARRSSRRPSCAPLPVAARFDRGGIRLHP